MSNLIGIKFGNNAITKLYWGTSLINKVYFGNTLVWEKASALPLPAPTIELTDNGLDIYDNSEGLAENFNLYIDNAFVDNIAKPVLNNFTISVDNASSDAFLISTDGENYTTISKGGSEEFSTYNNSIYIKVLSSFFNPGKYTYYVNNELVYVWDSTLNSLIYEMNIENNASYTIKSTYTGGGAGA